MFDRITFPLGMMPAIQPGTEFHQDRQVLKPPAIYPPLTLLVRIMSPLGFLRRMLRMRLHQQRRQSS